MKNRLWIFRYCERCNYIQPFEQDKTTNFANWSAKIASLVGSELITAPPNGPTCSKIPIQEGGEASTSQHWTVNLRGISPLIVIERSHWLLLGRNPRKTLRDNGSWVGTMFSCLVGFGWADDQFRRRHIARRRRSSSASADNLSRVPSRKPGIGRLFSRICICIKRYQRVRSRVMDNKLLQV